MTRTLCIFALMLFSLLATIASDAQSPARRAAIFITIGQSNADGSAFVDPALDAEAARWFADTTRTAHPRMWYRSTQVANRKNSIGENARHCVDGDTTDMAPGWLDLWYRNENRDGRTAMNMIHACGTYSTGRGDLCAQGRRGMEPQLAIDLADSIPDTDFYFIKLGVSGSFISSWANPLDDTNWHYFMDHIYRPAIDSLTAQGIEPRLAGIWWMQGCADQNTPVNTYLDALNRLINRLDTSLGYTAPPIYIGTIPAPGHSAQHPDGSVAYGPNVKAAQLIAAATHPNVTLIPTDAFDMQYEAPFNGHIHFSHRGQTQIAHILASHLTATHPHWPSPTR